MRRVIVIVAAGLALAGCTSGGGMGMNLDWWPKFEPAPVSVQFQSEPAGAEAKTSVGQTCKTPCALAMAPDKDFSVTFSLAGYEPQTVPVQVTKAEGESIREASLQPNPVAVELAPMPKAPPKRKPARKPSTATSSAKPAAAKPATPRPAAAAPKPAAAAPATPPATDPWPAVR